MKIVINRSLGRFGLSKLALEELGLKSNRDIDFNEDKNRTDPKLVACVEKLGKLANGRYAVLKVVEIPDDVDWYISKYEGLEHVAEDHRTWK